MNSFVSAGAVALLFSQAAAVELASTFTSSPGGDHVVTELLVDTASSLNNAEVHCYEVCRGEEIIFTSCYGCENEGDTYFRLTQGSQTITENDDSCGLLSEVRHTRVLPGCGEVCLHAGCFSNNACRADFEVIRNSVFPLTTPVLSDTDSASRNTFKACHSGCEGETITFDACSSASDQDTDLRLYNLDGEFLAYDDLTCGIESGDKEEWNAKLEYVVTDPGCHEYCVEVGCYDIESCSAVVDFSVRLTDPAQGLPSFACPPPEPNTDGAGLCGLVHSTNVHSVLKDWTCLRSQPRTAPCGDEFSAAWTGVQCDADGRVVSVNWGSAKSYIEGKIPSSIRHLTKVRSLQFHHHMLAHELPSQLADLPLLETLDLRHNLFTGSVPSSFAGLKERNVKVKLAGNQLVGVDNQVTPEEAKANHQ